MAAFYGALWEKGIASDAVKEGRSALLSLLLCRRVNDRGNRGTTIQQWLGVRWPRAWNHDLVGVSCVRVGGKIGSQLGGERDVVAMWRFRPIPSEHYESSCEPERPAISAMA
jgi:hypothetical protein